MRAHYLQHVPFEGLGSIETWLREAGHTIDSTRFFAAEALPTIDQLDLLVVMGGPMSINDEKAFSWLSPEKAFIRAVVDAGKPVLGVCLGAQLIASALGAEVTSNPVKEIGWFPVEGVAPSDAATFRFPPSAEVFHWHGETFSLPAGATRLARSVGCENQAFQIGRSVIGLQFHLETTPESARAIVANCRDELVPAPYVQSEAQILAVGGERYADIHRLMGDVLAYLCAGRD